MRTILFVIAFMWSATLFSQEVTTAVVTADQAQSEIARAEKLLNDATIAYKDKSDKAAIFEGQLANLDQSIKKLTDDRKLLQMQYKSAVSERNAAKQQVSLAKTQLKNAKKQLKHSLKN